MSLRTTFTTGIAVALLAVPVRAHDALDAFQAKYTNLKSVACSFRDATGISGSLKALKGGFYSVKLPDREIISDGKTVWNVMPATKTVMLNAYKPTSDEVSLERVFFLMLNIYRPTLTQSTKQFSTIRLIAPREDAVIANIREVNITLNRKNIITAVSIDEYGSTTTWYLSKLVLNKSIPRSTFQYRIPVGWQTIDLR